MSREARQFVRFLFLRVDPLWRRLSTDERGASLAEFGDLVGRWEDRILLRTFSTIGMRGDCDFMLWQVSERLEDFQELASEIAASPLGAYLETAYSYLSMTKHSTYVLDHTHPGQEGSRLVIAPGNARYLFVYPFWKTRPWYALPFAERQRMMNVHIALGHKYTSVKIHTT